MDAFSSVFLKSNAVVSDKAWRISLPCCAYRVLPYPKSSAWLHPVLLEEEVHLVWKVVDEQKGDGVAGFRTKGCSLFSLNCKYLEGMDGFFPDDSKGMPF